MADRPYEAKYEDAKGKVRYAYGASKTIEQAGVNARKYGESMGWTLLRVTTMGGKDA